MGPDDNKILGGSIFHGRSKICKGRLLSVLSGTIRSPNLDLGGGNLFVENKMFRVKSSFAEICLYFCLICYQRMIWYLCNICIKRYYWWSSVLNKRHWGKDLLDGGSGENTGEEAFDLLPSSNFQQSSSLKFFLYPHPQLANPWIHHIFPLFKSVIFLQLFISTHEGWWQTRRGDKRLWWLHGFCHNASFQPLHYPPHQAL